MLTPTRPKGLLAMIAIQSPVQPSCLSGARPSPKPQQVGQGHEENEKEKKNDEEEVVVVKYRHEARR